MNKMSIILNGVIKENPTFVLLLGMCPTLGTTSSAENGMGMGLATTFVLICSAAQKCAIFQHASYCIIYKNKSGQFISPPVEDGRILAVCC